MKILRQLAIILLTAAIAIGAYETYWHWTDATHFHKQYLRSCISTYEKHADILQAVLPRLRDQEIPANPREMILDPLVAYIRGDTPESRVIEIPLESIGDFYRHTYLYGLVWAADYDLLLAKNPEMILISLENGWCAYVTTHPQ
ncbi:MAG: hypothetical protein IJB81_12680 [Clostridia bacterium]|nr:hypothetical protein [Clostridia bacterium]